MYLVPHFVFQCKYLRLLAKSRGFTRGKANDPGKEMHHKYSFLLGVPRFIEEPCNVVAKVGQTAIIDCVVRGDRSDNNHDEIVCQWFYEGRLISEHDTRYCSEMNQFIIQTEPLEVSSFFESVPCLITFFLKTTHSTTSIIRKYVYIFPFF